MTYKEKANFMLHALIHDYFGYGTIVTKLKSGKYKIIVDGEKNYYTLHQLAEDYDSLGIDEINDIKYVFNFE